MDSEYWGFHPMQSDVTLELKKDDFLQKFLGYTGKVHQVTELDDSK